MAIDENSMEADYFADILTPQAEASTEEQPKAEQNIEPEAKEAPVTEARAEDEAPIVQETAPKVEEIKEEAPKKLWTPEFEENINSLLSKKHGYKSLNEEQRALAFLAAQNPELDEKDLSFLAMSKYGIGLEQVDESELTDAQIKELRLQSIDKKKLISEANGFFQKQADSIELPELPNPLDLDPDYKAYKEQSAKAAQVQQQQKEVYENTLREIETNAKSISEIKESIDIDIDEGKLSFDVNFKLNEEKQQQLVDYVKNYTPTDAEVKQFTDPNTGKFDYKGYMQSQAVKVFAKDIMAAGMKQALAKDRQQFIEKELKNSTLRNNDVSETVETPYDVYSAYTFG